MCAACAAEYHDPANRRFHAQPVCCPACGPRLTLLAADGTQLSGPQSPPDAALAGAVAALAGGQVLAVKGLGGYHLAVDAASEQAAALLRARKHREDKPFAVMVAGPGRCAGPVRGGRPGGEPAGQSPAAHRAAAAPGRPARRDRGGQCAQARGGRGAGQPPAGRAAALHPAASSAAPRLRPPHGADQRQRLRRADRLPGRRRPGPAGRHRRCVPHPRPADPYPDRRLGGPPVPWPGGRAAPLPGLRAGAADRGQPLRPAGAGLRRGAEEHVLPRPRGPGLPLPSRR